MPALRRLSLLLSSMFLLTSTGLSLDLDLSRSGFHRNHEGKIVMLFASPGPPAMNGEIDLPPRILEAGSDGRVILHVGDIDRNVGEWSGSMVTMIDSTFEKLLIQGIFSGHLGAALAYFDALQEKQSPDNLRFIEVHDRAR